MSAARGARLFVALPLGAALAEGVAAPVAALLGREGFRVAAAAGLHLTLHFLGQVERERIGALVSALGEALAGVAAPSLRLGGTGAFPSLARPRVLWVGVAERAAPERLAACRQAVLRGLARAGIDTRAEQLEPFRPHVSVARPRARSVRVPPEFVGLGLDLAWNPPAVVLFESRRGDEGSRYEALERFPFMPGVPGAP